MNPNTAKRSMISCWFCGRQGHLQWSCYTRATLISDLKVEILLDIDINKNWRSTDVRKESLQDAGALEDVKGYQSAIAHKDKDTGDAREINVNDEEDIAEFNNTTVSSDRNADMEFRSRSRSIGQNFSQSQLMSRDEESVIYCVYDVERDEDMLVDADEFAIACAENAKTGKEHTAKDVEFIPTEPKDEKAAGYTQKEIEEFNNLVEQYIREEKYYGLEITHKKLKKFRRQAKKELARQRQERNPVKKTNPTVPEVPKPTNVTKAPIIPNHHQLEARGPTVPTIFLDPEPAREASAYRNPGPADIERWLSEHEQANSVSTRTHKKRRCQRSN